MRPRTQSLLKSTTRPNELFLPVRVSCNRQYFWKKVSRQRPRSAMPWKTLEKSGIKPAAPNRLADRKHCALSTQPNPHLHGDFYLGFGWVDKAQFFQSARRFRATGSSPDFSRVFRDMALPGLCLETFFQCTKLSYPGQPPSSRATLLNEERGRALWERRREKFERKATQLDSNLRRHPEQKSQVETCLPNLPPREMKTALRVLWRFAQTRSKFGGAHSRASKHGHHQVQLRHSCFSWY